jgi:hypothetical protein
MKVEQAFARVTVFRRVTESMPSRFDQQGSSMNRFEPFRSGSASVRGASWLGWGLDAAPGRRDGRVDRGGLGNTSEMTINVTIPLEGGA